MLLWSVSLQIEQKWIGECFANCGIPDRFKKRLFYCIDDCEGNISRHMTSLQAIPALRTMMEMYMACRPNTVRTCYHRINLDNPIFNVMFPNLVTRQRGSLLVRCWMQSGVRGSQKDSRGVCQLLIRPNSKLMSQTIFGLHGMPV